MRDANPDARADVTLASDHRTGTLASRTRRDRGKEYQTGQEEGSEWPTACDHVRTKEREPASAPLGYCRRSPRQKNSSRTHLESARAPVAQVGRPRAVRNCSQTARHVARAARASSMYAARTGGRAGSRSQGAPRLLLHATVPGIPRDDAGLGPGMSTRAVSPLAHAFAWVELGMHSAVALRDRAIGDIRIG